MNDYWAAVLLGIVEGLTEFLPVSSTAHLRLCQKLIGQDLESGYWKMFAIVIQLGAILAVVAYFWKRIVKFVRSYPLFNKYLRFSKPEADPPIEYTAGSAKTWWNHPLALVGLSFVVTAVPCLIIDQKIGERLENTTIIGWALIIGGLVMMVIDFIYERRSRTRSMEEMSLGQALFVGFAQIFSAAFPGTSRSMSTIAGGQIVGLDRSTALEFSFFLSIPVMLAASGFKLLQYVAKSPESLNLDQLLVLAIGFGVSFVVALLVIAWFMAWVRRRGFTPFAIYRMVIGILVLWWM